jgi:hypothetical protein
LRAADDPHLNLLGVGVLGVEGDGTVSVVRSAAVQDPKVWGYYYLLAHHVARNA